MKSNSTNTPQPPKAPPKNFSHFHIEHDVGPNAFYPELCINIDDEGDVIVASEDGSLMLSYAQAHALLFKLSQELIAYDRSFGYRPRNSIKEVTNER